MLSRRQKKRFDIVDRLIGLFVEHAGAIIRCLDHARPTFPSLRNGSGWEDRSKILRSPLNSKRVNPQEAPEPEKVSTTNKEKPRRNSNRQARDLLRKSRGSGARFLEPRVVK